ncbi:hypothetical protein [Staphylococcus agnetis]|uniref:hypothetical protein n=1 Tax=Staphylococcus agnetis TaxID=985762 RepID=UPI000D19C5F4|nr:hypothetical protein [Staphylococcus agnetis]NJH85617.1 hypothetical protein [Staphylococcus agnetis]NJI14514.1 hypothetical protein [Staphylococcus agnetis]PTH40880.1 hypothetical protein BU588_04480 [Staphylococcus agnetis]
MKITFDDIINQQGFIQAHYYDDDYMGDIRFELTDPIDVRNDLVAEALGALCGQYYDEIEIAFKVSTVTKAEIEKRTNAKVICSTGIRFWNLNKMISNDVKTLNFSGDVANLSALTLTPGDTNQVSLDFGAESIHMYEMFDRWHSRIVKTNVMETHFPLITSDYYAIGAILYKDYFNTRYMITGLQLNPITANMTKIEAEQAIAGMVNLPHTLGLTAVGHTQIACRQWGEELNTAIQTVKASQPEVVTQQHLLVMIENDRKRLGLPIDNTALTPTHISWGENMKLDFLALYVLKHRGRAFATYLVKDIPKEAEAWVDHIHLDFYERYYPGVLSYMPHEIKMYVQQQLAQFEIALYTDDDWHAFQMIREKLLKTRK